MVEDGEMFGQDKDRSLLLDDTVIILSQDQLRQVSWRERQSDSIKDDHGPTIVVRLLQS